MNEHLAFDRRSAYQGGANTCDESAGVVDFHACARLKLGGEVLAENCTEAEDEYVVFVRGRLEGMRQNDFLLRCSERDLKPTLRTMESCTLKLVAAYLRVFVVTEVRQGTKQNCTLTNEGVNVLRGKILVKAGQTKGLTLESTGCRRQSCATKG